MNQNAYETSVAQTLEIIQKLSDLARKNKIRKIAVENIHLEFDLSDLWTKALEEQMNAETGK